MKNKKIRLIAGCGMLTAAAVVLQYLEFPIPIMPGFIKLDFSDLPELIGAFAYGPVAGIIIALLAKSSDNSAYLRFHIKQMLMILISEVMTGFVSAVLCWTCIVPVAGTGLLLFLYVTQIICFINVCRNKSVEPLLVRKLTFLK